MKSLPPGFTLQEKHRELQWARERLAFWVALALSSNHHSRFISERLGWWGDYVKRREKELEDERE